MPAITSHMSEGSDDLPDHPVHDCANRTDTKYFKLGSCLERLDAFNLYSILYSVLGCMEYRMNALRSNTNLVDFIAKHASLHVSQIALHWLVGC